MNAVDLLPIVLTLGLLAVATAWDLRTRRIPNLLTLPAALLGMAVQIALNGANGAEQALLGWLAGLALLAIPCAMGWVGAGDVKLLAAVGSVQGPLMALVAGLYGLMAGGLLIIGIILVQQLVRRGSAAGQPIRRLTLPYGPALAIGTVLALAFR